MVRSLFPSEICVTESMPFLLHRVEGLKKFRVFCLVRSWVSYAVYHLTLELTRRRVKWQPLPESSVNINCDDGQTRMILAVGCSANCSVFKLDQIDAKQPFLFVVSLLS